MSARNRQFLDLELRRLRLLLARHVLWLRSRWRSQQADDYQGMAISDSMADLLLAGGEDAEGEARFQASDAQVGALSAEATALEHQSAALRQGLPLTRLAAAFDLTAFDCHVLLLTLALELDASFATLYAYAQDDVQRTYATAHLAVALCTHGQTERQQARQRFAAEAPLRRFGLVYVEAGAASTTALSARPLRLDERISEFLQGVAGLDPRLSQVTRPVTELLLPAAQQGLVEEILRRLEASEGALLNLTGPPDAGKVLVAREVMACRGLTLLHLDAQRFGAPGSERDELYRIAGREARLASLAYFANGPEADPAEKNQLAQFNDLVERLEATVVIDSPERWTVDRKLVIAAVLRPDRVAQIEMWGLALGEQAARLEEAVLDIVEQFDLGPEGIARSAEEAAGRAHAVGTGLITPSDLWQACRVYCGWLMEDMAQKITPAYGWGDIVLTEDTMSQLREMAAQVARRAQVYELWGFARKIRRGRGIGALFSGPSGVGKTMAAEVLAQELELDLYRIDLAGIVSKYIGETEKNLRKIFDAAEQSGAILFFDEADALFGKRTEVKDSHDRYANIEVNYLLQRMEEYRGLAILATNRKSSLDRAFLRRLRFLVDFPFPDAAYRKQIWMRSFPKEAPVEDLDFNFLARLEISGGNIRNIALNAAFLAAERGGSIGPDEILHAVRREYAKIDKLVTESEFGRHYEVKR